MTNNLWLNLTDGAVLCGRRYFDGKRALSKMISSGKGQLDIVSPVEGGYVTGDRVGGGVIIHFLTSDA